MTRRILSAIVAVAAVAVAGFGVVLGLVVQRLYREEAVLRLEREATLAAAQVPASFMASGDPVELPAPERHTVLGLYDTAGARIVGEGPDRGDGPVRRAWSGRANDARLGGWIIVAVPAAAEEEVFAVVRAAVAETVVTDRIRRSWLAMAATGTAIVGASALVAVAQARRLGRPVAALVEDVRRLGGGDFTTPAGRSGIAELDAAAHALDATAQRLGRLLERERAFSAEASHQLRTPLTGIRLRLENALATAGRARDEAMADAIGQVDRLEATIEDLLNLARDVEPGGDAALDVASVLAAAEQAWHGPLAAAGRALRVATEPGLPAVRASAAALRQVLDVLLANAAEHGSGTVILRARTAGTGLVVEVSDEGPGVQGDTDLVFGRRTDPTGRRGLGLALARSLIEAEGGRLLLRAAGPSPTFSVVLPARPARA